MITWWQIGRMCGELAREHVGRDGHPMIRGLPRERDFLPKPWRDMKPIPVYIEGEDYSRYMPVIVPPCVYVAQKQAIKDYLAGFREGRNNHDH